MAKTMETSSASTSNDYDMTLWYDSKYYKLGLGVMVGVAIYLLSL